MGNLTSNRKQQAVLAVDIIPVVLERGDCSKHSTISRNNKDQPLEQPSAYDLDLSGQDGLERSPLTRTLSSSSQRSHGSSTSSTFSIHNKALFTALIAIIGTAATAAFLSIGITGANQDQKLQFDNRAKELAKAIETAWAEYQTFGLLIHKECHVQSGVEGMDNNSTDLPYKCTREGFRELYEYISSVGIEFQSAQYMPNVTQQHREAAEAEAQQYLAESYPDVNYRGFVGFQTDPNTGETGVFARSQQPFYFPVHFIEPVIGNEAAIGLDLYSSQIQRKTLERAVAAWKPALTDRLKLVQDTDPNAYSVILHHPGVPVSTHPDVLEPSGISLMVVRIHDLLKRAALAGSEGKSVYVYDSTDANSDPVFLGGIDSVVDSGGDVDFYTKAEEGIESVMNVGNHFSYRTETNIADRVWTIAVVPLSGTFQPSILYVVLGGTIIFVACMMLAVWYYTSMNRIAKIHQIRSRAEAEKAIIVVETARRQAASERGLNDFIAHEVRNPLSSAIAALSFVSSAVNEDDENGGPSTLGKNKTIREDLNIIEASLQFINELLRNMLDMHRAASKQIKIVMIPTDILNDVFQPVAAMMHTRGNKGVEFILDCPENLVVMADPLRLKQITLNLANNSLKFVERGFIRLRADLADGQVRIYLEDSGPGIPAEKHDILFSKFQESLDLLNQGTGIGLNLCKQLALLMEGDIWLDETYDSEVPGCVGSCFVVDLKKESMALVTLESASAARLDKSVATTVDEFPTSSKLSERVTFFVASPEFIIEDLPGNLSVLFVDDDAMIRKLFMRSMKRIAPDWEYEQAVNGETALKLADEKEYDLIFVDQYMASAKKQLLGTETVRALRSKGCQAKICGLSANDVEEGFLEAGADYFLFKPFRCKKELLIEDILRFMNAVNPTRQKDTQVAAMSA